MDYCYYQPATLANTCRTALLLHLNLTTSQLAVSAANHSPTRCCASDSCEICELEKQLGLTRAWFCHAGTKYQSQFLSKLILLCNSSDILQYLIQVLHVVDSKDAIYSFVRRESASKCDYRSHFPRAVVHKAMSRSCEWFCSANIWKRISFLLGILAEADLQVLRSARDEMRNLEALRLLMLRLGLLKSSGFCYHAQDNNSKNTGGEEDRVVDSNWLKLLRLLEKGEDSGVKQFLKKISSKAASDDSTPLSPFFRLLTGLDVAGKESELMTPNFPAKNRCNDDTSKTEAESGPKRCPASVLRELMTATAEICKKNIKSDLIQDLCSQPLTKLLENFGSSKPDLNELSAINDIAKEASTQMKTILRQKVTEDASPHFATDVLIVVPNIDHHTQNAIPASEGDKKNVTKQVIYFANKFEDLETRFVRAEVRNLFCGDYQTHVLIKRHDLTRIVDHDGSQLIAVSGLQSIRFFSLKTLRPVELGIKGRYGAIRCIHLLQNNHVVFTGGYDTTVRCWSTQTGRCKRIYVGHNDTVLCLATWGSRLAAGSKDGRTKVWDYCGQRFLHAFRDNHPVTSVALNGLLCITGCRKGSIRAFSIMSGRLVKQLAPHKSVVTCVRADQWFIMSASRDCFARVWSAVGKVDRCLTELQHPKEVTYVELKYLRVLTGCWDGRIRIWDVESGVLLKILAPTTEYTLSPILSFHSGNNWIVVNTVAQLIVLKFAPIRWNHHQRVGLGVSTIDFHSSRRPPLDAKSVPSFRSSKWIPAVAAALTPRAVRILKSYMKEAESQRPPRSKSTTSLTDFNTLFSVTMEQAKTILWSQKRQPFETPVQEPLATIISKLRTRPVRNRHLPPSRSANRLDEPFISQAVGKRANKLKATIDDRWMNQMQTLWQRLGNLPPEPKKILQPKPKEPTAKINIWDAARINDSSSIYDERTGKTSVKKMNLRHNCNVQQPPPTTTNYSNEQNRIKIRNRFTTTGSGCSEPVNFLYKSSKSQTLPQQAPPPVSIARNPFSQLIDLQLHTSKTS